MKIRKKVKLVHGTIILMAIAFVALATIVIVSFATSSKLDSYYSKISKDRINNIELYGDLSTGVNALRYSTLKFAASPYSDEYAAELENVRANNQEIINKLKGQNLDDTEKQELKKYKKI